MNISTFLVLLLLMFVIVYEPSLIFEGGGDTEKKKKRRSAKKRKKVEVIDLTEKGKSKYDAIEIEDDEEEKRTNEEGWYCEKPYKKNNSNIRDRINSCKRKKQLNLMKCIYLLVLFGFV